MYLSSLLLSPYLHLKETFLGICAGGDCSGLQGPEAFGVYQLPLNCAQTLACWVDSENPYVLILTSCRSNPGPKRTLHRGYVPQRGCGLVGEPKVPKSHTHESTWDFRGGHPAWEGAHTVGPLLECALGALVSGQCPQRGLDHSQREHFNFC